MGNCAELQVTPGFDSADYRRALSRFATGIVVVTSELDDGSRAGVTVNSFTSVSLEPPLVLWCLARTSAVFERFQACTHFAANVLGQHQADLSRQFSAKHCDRFAGVAWFRGQGGSPLLTAALASFECTVEDRLTVGDHVVFVGRVRHYSRGEGEPLVFHSGGYWQTSAAAAA